ncbi:Uma2 family endonuclease [Lewinella aquimaris]|uniref:Uma2 family endonuclease n=1 Tax=Neolewinella aquimaris TaxID=1835722 RepID=A0A840EE29_9BACT|nr:Uma2 family endonuclease [Neolewinella aquimaris]MBB4079196.1 Uma2 family endonuclease [Neolewinella aquimaris]
MNAEQLSSRQYTLEEYYQLLAKSPVKYEYADGTIRMMAGAKASHNRIVKNCFRAFDGASSDCEFFLSDTAVSISSNKIYFPDLSAVCEETVEAEEGGIERITNPSLIIEVLSQNTAHVDRGEKFQSYWQLPSMQEYVLIDSQSYLVETYFRETSDFWRIGSSYKLEQDVTVRTLGITLPLANLYEGVSLEME